MRIRAIALLSVLLAGPAWAQTYLNPGGCTGTPPPQGLCYDTVAQEFKYSTGSAWVAINAAGGGGGGTTAGFVNAPTVTAGNPATVTLAHQCTSAGCTEDNRVVNGSNANGLQITTAASANMPDGDIIKVTVADTGTAPTAVTWVAGSGVTLNSAVLGDSNATPGSTTSCGIPPATGQLTYIWTNQYAVAGNSSASTMRLLGCALDPPPSALPVALGGTAGTSASATTAHNIGAAALGANSDITSLTGLSTPLSVSQGGTGLTSATANALLYGGGASPFASLALVNDQLALGNTSAAPTATTLPSSGCTTTQGLNYTHAGGFACQAITATASPGGTTGAIQYNNAGSLGGVVITGVVVGNGTSAPSALAGNTLASHNFANSISASGVISGAQPAFSDISGTATGAQLPNPSASTLGGVQSLAAVSHKWINTISTSGVPSATQPASTDLSDIPIPVSSGGNGTVYGAQGTQIQIANASSTGTTVNTLTKLTGAPSTAVIAATTDKSGIIGITTSGAGTAGNAVVQLGGSGVSCVFDNATTAGDYVQISSGTAGNCHDVGATLPTSNQLIGRVLSTNGGAGTYAIDLFAGGGNGAAPPGIISTPTPSAGAVTLTCACQLPNCMDNNRIANGTNTGTLTITTCASGGMSDGETMYVEVDMDGTHAPSSIAWTGGSGVTLDFANLGNSNATGATGSCGAISATGVMLYNLRWNSTVGDLTLLGCGPRPAPATLTAGLQAPNNHTTSASVAVSGATTLTLPASGDALQLLTFSASATVTIPQAAWSGQALHAVVCQNGTGGFTPTFAAAGGLTITGTFPVFTTTLNKCGDFDLFYYSGTQAYLFRSAAGPL
jgi:hypothetical protein